MTDASWPPSKPAEFRRTYTDALWELLRAGDISDRGFVYGIRVIELAWRSRTFFESERSSAAELGKSPDTIKRARKELCKAGILRRRPGPTFEGRSAVFDVCVPREASRNRRVRIEDRRQRRADLPPDLGGTDGTDAQNERQVCPRQGADSPGSTGEIAPLAYEEQGIEQGRSDVQVSTSEMGSSIKDSAESPIERRRRQVDREVMIALGRAPEIDRGELEPRIRILAEMFVTCGQVPHEAKLRGYCRTTRKLPVEILKEATDEARIRDASGRGFPPTEAAILEVGHKLEMRRRKQWRKAQEAHSVAHEGPTASDRTAAALELQTA